MLLLPDRSDAVGRDIRIEIALMKAYGPPNLDRSQPPARPKFPNIPWCRAQIGGSRLIVQQTAIRAPLIRAPIAGDAAHQLDLALWACPAHRVRCFRDPTFCARRGHAPRTLVAKSEPGERAELGSGDAVSSSGPARSCSIHTTASPAASLPPTIKRGTVCRVTRDPTSAS